MDNENFYEAAVRYWLGGCILNEQEEYDGAVCLYGFSAECALKAIMQKISGNGAVKKYSHFAEELFQDMKLMFSADLASIAMIDPAWVLRLSGMSFPAVLFRDHPVRRYFKDSVYSKDDAENCQNAVGILIREIASMRLDGYI